MLITPSVSRKGGPVEERVPYGEIRAWFLNCYYVYCQDKIAAGRGWAERELEINWAYNEFDNAFQLPIENLMVEALTLILEGGRLPDTEAYHRNRIANILEQNNLEDMMREISEDEAHELRYDLKILGITA